MRPTPLRLARPAASVMTAEGSARLLICLTPLRCRVDPSPRPHWAAALSAAVCVIAPPARGRRGHGWAFGSSAQAATPLDGLGLRTRLLSRPENLTSAAMSGWRRDEGSAAPRLAEAGQPMVTTTLPLARPLPT
jgi:hypothetical protein